MPVFLAKLLRGHPGTNFSVASMADETSGTSGAVGAHRHELAHKVGHLEGWNAEVYGDVVKICVLEGIRSISDAIATTRKVSSRTVHS